MELVGVLEGLLFVVGNEGISFDKLMEVLTIIDKHYKNNNKVNVEIDIDPNRL